MPSVRGASCSRSTDRRSGRHVAAGGRSVRAGRGPLLPCARAPAGRRLRRGRAPLAGLAWPRSPARLDADQPRRGAAGSGAAGRCAGERRCRARGRARQCRCLVDRLIAAQGVDAHFESALDLGCGTGLCGPAMTRGLFCFSVEALVGGGDLRLLASLRYAHARPCLVRLAPEHGFTVVAMGSRAGARRAERADRRALRRPAASRSAMAAGAERRRVDAVDAHCGVVRLANWGGRRCAESCS